MTTQADDTGTAHGTAQAFCGLAGMALIAGLFQAALAGEDRLALIGQSPVIAIHHL